MAILRRFLLIGLASAAGCADQPNQPDQPAQTETKRAAVLAKEVREACASRNSQHRLKNLAFRQAIAVRRADSPLLRRLYGQSVVRLEEPVVKRRDKELNVTVCGSRFILELPPGVTDAFDGDRRLAADIEYAAQPAADGSGLVYQMSGAEPIIYRLAAVALHEPPPAPPPVVIPYAPPAPAASAPPRVSQFPSSDCRNARSADERMICSDAGLAKRNRRVAAAYAKAMRSVDARGRQVLERSRQRFLEYRRGCRDEACLEEALEDRVDEIRDISADYRD